MARKFDVIIFGASGYTGRYVVRNAVELLNGMKWAIAGRNKSKLEETLKDSGTKINEDLSKIPIIIADVADEKSLTEMAKQAKVIVNTCGPYYLYGEAVVKACIENGASHVDVSGEPQYIDDMQLKYDQAAREKGVFIVSACGMESIPSEMGISFLKENFNGTINSVENYMRTFYDKGFDPKGPGLNYGTYHSAVIAFSKFFELQRIRNKLYPRSLPKFKPKVWNRLAHREEAVDKRWSLPLIEPDEGVVTKTQRFFYEKEGTRPIQFHAYMAFDSLLFFLSILFVAPIFVILSQFNFGVNILLNFPNYFFLGITEKEGPKEETVEKINFEMTFVARGWRETNVPREAKIPINKKMVTKVSMTNPAYQATSISLLLAARTIIKETSKLPEAGVLTPGIAFEKTSMISELKKHGWTFEVVRIDE